MSIGSHLLNDTGPAQYKVENWSKGRWANNEAANIVWTVAVREVACARQVARSREVVSCEKQTDRYRDVRFDLSIVIGAAVHTRRLDLLLAIRSSQIALRRNRIESGRGCRSSSAGSNVFGDVSTIKSALWYASLAGIWDSFLSRCRWKTSPDVPSHITWWKTKQATNRELSTGSWTINNLQSGSWGARCLKLRLCCSSSNRSRACAPCSSEEFGIVLEGMNVTIFERSIVGNCK